MFFAEKDANNTRIDYFDAVGGRLKLVPEGASRAVLAQDYAAMREDGLLAQNPPEFETILETCAALKMRLIVWLKGSCAKIQLY